MTTNNDNCISYRIMQEVKNWRLRRGYSQSELASKIGTEYQVILQYEKGKCQIPIKKLYALAEVLSVSVKDLICGTNEKRNIENEGEEILSLAIRYKEINDQEIREMFYLLTKFMRISEEKSEKVVKLEVAKNLFKLEVSVDVISRTTNLSIDDYEEKKIPVDSVLYKIGQRIKEWRLRRGYTQEGLANNIGIQNQRIYEYEQGRSAVSIKTLNEIAKALSVDIINLLPQSVEDEVENELTSLIEEYKKIESKELRHMLIKLLFESIRECREKVRERKIIGIAKSLIKEGVCIDIIEQATGYGMGQLLN